MWTWHISVLIGCSGLVVGYLILVNLHPTRRIIPYLAGVLVLLLALVSPLDALGDTYLFSAHMIQHQLLILVVPPLLLLGIPTSLVEKALRIRAIARLEKLLRKPWLAWLLGIGTIGLWHLPALYNAALANETIHLLEHLSFLATSLIFWWPILAPLERLRMNLPAQALYLLLALAASDTLGTLLAYTPPGLYPAYLNPPDPYGILPLLRNVWHISPSADQQAGGLLMGFTSDPVYLLVALSALARWYAHQGFTPI